MYTRFRYCNPALGADNAQDPLGLAPRLAPAQGYVDFAAHWVDVLRLHGRGHAEEAESSRSYCKGSRGSSNCALHGGSRAKPSPRQSGWYENHAEQKRLNYAKQNNIQPAEMHSVYNFCSNRGGSIPGCVQVLSRNGFMTVSPQLDSAYPVRFTQDGLNIIRNRMR